MIQQLEITQQSKSRGFHLVTNETGRAISVSTGIMVGQETWW